MEPSTEQVHKKHVQPRAGRSHEKKVAAERRRQGLEGAQPVRDNAKAFGGSGRGHVERDHRILDHQQNRAHVPLEKRLWLPLAAPAVIAVVGPPKSGKTTLITSLVKLYARQKLVSIKGPVTVVAGRGRRATFVECGSDINSMCDVARVADLVLMVVDASYGFEMETFEYLNIAQSHGFSKVFGVLTHLDYIKSSKALKKTKKLMKHRFWQEVCPGAKLFFLSGLHGGMYPPMEIHNLHKFLSVTTVFPRHWRSTHSCVLVDRMEDLTPADALKENPDGNHKVAFYGYVRGKAMHVNQKVHLPGVGDFTLSEISVLEDPCPLPGRRKNIMRHLLEKHRRLHAPMSDVGDLRFDRQQLFLNSSAPARSGTGIAMLRKLMGVVPLDDP
eukprot:RCo038042